jgi:hypothetical protein
MRTVLRIVITAAVIVGTALPATAAQPGDDGLTLIVPTLTPMLPGQEGWIGTMWSAGFDVCDVEITGSGPGLGVSYPANTATFSSLYTSSGLAEGNLDMAAFNLSVPATAVGAIPVTLSVNYRQLPPGLIKKSDDLKTKKFPCAGPKGEQTIATTLPITPFTGPPVIQVTNAVSVPKAQPTWVNITFTGNQPNLNDFRVSLAPPAGMTVAYPGDATSAGLNGSPTLPVAREDFVAVNIDPAGLGPGVYPVPLHATYTGGVYDGTLAVTVT